MRWVSGEETAFSKYLIGSRKAGVYAVKVVISGNLLAFGLVPGSHRDSTCNMRLAARYAWAAGQPRRLSPRVHGGFLLRLPQPSKHTRRRDSLRLLDRRYPPEH